MEFHSHLTEPTEDNVDYLYKEMINSSKLETLDLSVKSGGEFHLKGITSNAVIERLVECFDYHQDQQRSKDQSYREGYKIMDMMTISILGTLALCLVIFACLTSLKQQNMDKCSNVSENVNTQLNV